MEVSVENKKGRLVEIHWVDSWGDDNIWQDIDGMEFDDPPICKSVGVVLNHNKTYITITSTVTSKQVLGRLMIPLCVIQGVTEL